MFIQKGLVDMDIGCLSGKVSVVVSGVLHGVAQQSAMLCQTRQSMCEGNNKNGHNFVISKEGLGKKHQHSGSATAE